MWCLAYREDGRICGEPATVLDTQRRGMVCEAHAPQPQQGKHEHALQLVCILNRRIKPHGMMFRPYNGGHTVMDGRYQGIGSRGDDRACQADGAAKPRWLLCL